MLKTLLNIGLNVGKGLFNIRNIPLIGDAVEEVDSEDGGKGQFQQVNLIRLIRKIARILMILLAAYLIMKGDDEKAEKIKELEKKIYFVNFDDMAPPRTINTFNYERI